MVECAIVHEEVGRDTMRLDLQPEASSALTPLRLELPAYAYYRLGLDARRRVAVQLRPEWLHLMPAP